MAAASASFRRRRRACSAARTSPGRRPDGASRRGRRPRDRAGLAGQDQEGRLEGVLDVVLVPQDRPAGRQDHRPVPGHQRSNAATSLDEA
ncbi:MAG: hypothetical protein WKF75_15020 [Singulisphaera sp.]